MLVIARLFFRGSVALPSTIFFWPKGIFKKWSPNWPLWWMKSVTRAETIISNLDFFFFFFRPSCHLCGMCLPWQIQKIGMFFHVWSFHRFGSCSFQSKMGYFTNLNFQQRGDDKTWTQCLIFVSFSPMFHISCSHVLPCTAHEENCATQNWTVDSSDFIFNCRPFTVHANSDNVIITAASGTWLTTVM